MSVTTYILDRVEDDARAVLEPASGEGRLEIPRTWLPVDAEVYRTDQHGTVRVVAHENGGFEVETERDVPHAAPEPDRDLAVDPHKLMGRPET